jgi:metal-responsive CopG/Arc/MetJ family transcriptional regulator
MQKVEVVNVRLPKEVINWLDQLVAKNIFKSRSEAIRQFAREYVLEQREAGK